MRCNSFCRTLCKDASCTDKKQANVYITHYQSTPEGAYLILSNVLMVIHIFKPKSGMRTLVAKFDNAMFHFSLVLVPATCPAFATLLKAPFSHAVPAVTYLQFKRKISTSCQQEYIQQLQYNKHICVYEWCTLVLGRRRGGREKGC